MSIRDAARLVVASAVGVFVAGCSHNGAPETASAPAAAPAMAVAAAPKLPPGVTSQMVAQGDSIFHTGSCQRCHGMDAKGTARAPNLTDDTWSQITGTYDEIVKIVTTGVPKAQIKMAGAQFAMNPRGGTNLTDDQIKSVAAYVYTLSHK